MYIIRNIINDGRPDPTIQYDSYVDKKYVTMAAASKDCDELIDRFASWGSSDVITSKIDAWLDDHCEGFDDATTDGEQLLSWYETVRSRVRPDGPRKRDPLSRVL